MQQRHGAETGTFLRHLYKRHMGQWDLVLDFLRFLCYETYKLFQVIDEM